jgi:hypothetical protein
MPNVYKNLTSHPLPSAQPASCAGKMQMRQKQVGQSQRGGGTACPRPAVAPCRSRKAPKLVAQAVATATAVDKALVDKCARKCLPV